MAPASTPSRLLVGLPVSQCCGLARQSPSLAVTTTQWPRTQATCEQGQEGLEEELLGVGVLPPCVRVTVQDTLRLRGLGSTRSLGQGMGRAWG